MVRSLEWKHPVQESQGGSAALVLVIDDVGAIVDELITLLQLQGIASTGAGTLREAIAALRAVPSIKVVACDVRLGTESGLGIVPLVDADPRLARRGLRYVFMTGDPLSPECRRASTAHSLLTKPVSPRALVDLVKLLL